MYKYIANRVLLMIPTLFGAGLLVFALMRMVPGDICDVKMGGEGAVVTEEQLEITARNSALTGTWGSSSSTSCGVWRLSIPASRCGPANPSAMRSI